MTPRPKRWLALGMLATLGTVVGASALRAHARWDLTKTLKPRTNSTGEKTAPCGTAGPTTDASKRVVLKAGADLVVDWEETVNHTGNFRIAFSEDGVNGYDTHVLKTVADDQNTSTDSSDPSTFHKFTTHITVPDTLCDNCSLQLRQFMQPTNNYYYSCADVRIVAADSTEETPATAASASPEPETIAKPEPPTDLKATVRTIQPATSGGGW